jgi:acyl-CoA synthetase (AMP-forming)/AMP-acid ligase II
MKKAFWNRPFMSHGFRILQEIEDPHILMYTSGTTGIPKGAILSHRKTFFNALNADIFYNLTSRDIMIVARPLFHSGGLLVEAAPVLYKGGSLILRKRFRSHEILETIQKKSSHLVGNGRLRSINLCFRSAMSPNMT